MTAPLREFRRGVDGSLSARIDPRERAVLAEVVEGVVDLLDARAAMLRAEAGPPGPDPEDGTRAVEPGGADQPAHDEATAGPDAGGPQLGWPAIAAPQDPALLRLLPDAAADAELAAELRRLTESDVRDVKAQQVGLLHAALTADRRELLLTAAEAPAIAAALTDVRLVLGERLGLREDRDAERVYRLAVGPAGEAVDDEEATARFLAAVYVVLSELQESLVERLVDELPPVREDRAR